MSETVNSIESIALSVTRLLGAVQDAQGKLAESTDQVVRHNADPASHDMQNYSGEWRQIINKTVADAIGTRSDSPPLNTALDEHNVSPDAHAELFQKISSATAPAEIDCWNIYPLRSPLPVQNLSFEGRYPIMPGETTPRTNWLICDGGEDGFGGYVPDLRGKFIIGAGNSFAANSSGGSENHEHSITGSVSETTLSVDQTPVHTHTYTRATYYGTGVGTSGGEYAFRTSTSNTSEIGGSKSHTHGLSGVSSSSVSNLPPYHALTYIIRVS